MIPSGGFREREGKFLPNEESKGEVMSFRKLVSVRTDDEPLVDAPKLARCNIAGFSGHTIRHGSTVYDMGEKTKGIGHAYACSEHYHRMPTEEMLIHGYEQNIHIICCTISNFDNNSLVYAKTTD